MEDGEDEDDDIDEAAIWEQIRQKEAAEKAAAARPSPEQVGQGRSGQVKGETGGCVQA